MKLPHIILCALLMCTCACSKKAQVPQVIFDTDLGSDIDDVLALEMVLNYHQAGQINLRGITLSKANPMAVQFTDGYLRFHGLGDSVPIGWVYDGESPDDFFYLRPTLKATYGGKPLLPFRRDVEKTVPEGWKLLRKLLSESEDNSVELLSVGMLTNISRLLDSQADEYSNLNGLKLVAKKVKCLHLMNGMFGDDPFPEWNTITDLPASRTVFEKWPGKLVTSGWEVGQVLPYPHESIESDFGETGSHPLQVAYCHWGKMPYDRPTWDLTTVFEALDSDKEIFAYSEPGTISLKEDGTAVFSASESGMHRYLIIPGQNREKAVNAIVSKVTGK